MDFDYDQIMEENGFDYDDMDALVELLETF